MSPGQAGQAWQPTRSIGIMSIDTPVDTSHLDVSPRVNTIHSAGSLKKSQHSVHGSLSVEGFTAVVLLCHHSQTVLIKALGSDPSQTSW